MHLHEILRVVDDINNFWTSNNILRESALVSAFSSIMNALHGTHWALGGGLALGYHGTARATQDIDIFLPSEEALRVVLTKLGRNYKQIRKHAIEHRASGVEIELLTPEFLRVPSRLIHIALDNAIEPESGVRVLSRDGLVALKLQRCSTQDQADIERIISRGGPVNVEEYDLPPNQLAVLQQLLTSATQYALPDDEL